MIELNLLGSPLIKIPQHPALNGFSDRELALIAYIACQDVAKSRTQIGELLWTGRSSSQARSNLRTFLTRHRKKLEKVLIIGRDRISFKSAEGWVDAAEFSNRLQSAKRFGHRELKPTAKTAERYRKALRLYKGPFLDGVELNEDSDISEWIDLERDRFEQEMFYASEYLIQFSIHDERFEDGLLLCEELLTHDYYNEKIQRYFVHCLAYTKSAEAVRNYFETYTAQLQSDINVAPGKELTQAVKAILEDRHEFSAATQVYNSALSINIPSSPLPTRPLIGRHQEAALIKQKLIQSSQRLITIVGIGGIGKTHLALHSAEEIASEFVDGVLFVSLADQSPETQLAADSELHLIETLAAGKLNLTLNGRRETAEQLFSYLRERDMLIVIDNAESDLENVGPFATKLLAQAPGVKLLVTSRTPLNLRAELVVLLKNLSIPTEGTTIDHIALSEGSFDSVRLFDTCARLVFDQFEMTDANLPSIIRICHLVSGIPLAIELAATWIGHYSCEEIVEAIEQDISFLSTRFVDHPERHADMSQLFNHSWKLLNRDEQQALLKLSTFAGSFSRGAAEHLLDDSLGTLISLVDKSMLNISHGGRYDMHDLVRRFVSEKWTEFYGAQADEEQEKAKDQFGRYFFETVTALAAKLHVEEPAPIIKTIQLELSNILSGWRWALEARQFGLLIGTINSLSRFYHFTGLYHEALSHFTKSAESLEHLHPTLETEAQADFLKVMVRIQAKVSFYQLRLRQYTEGLRVAEKAVEYGQLADDPSALAEAHLNYGEANKFVNLIDLAEHSFNKALTLARDGSDMRLESVALRQMGRLAWGNGEIEEADRYYWQALAIERKRGDLLAQAQLVVALAQSAELRGNLSLAQSYYDEGIENCLKLTNNHRLNEIRLYLGQVYSFQGAYDRATLIFEQTLADSQEAGDVYSVGESYRGFAVVHYLEGRLDEGKIAAEKAFRLAQQHQDQHYHTLSMGTLGMIYQKIGQAEEAERMLNGALDLSRRLKFNKNMSDILIGLSLCRLDRGEIKTGLEFAEQALDASIGMVQHAMALVYLGNALTHANQFERAHDTDKKALALIRQIGLPRLEKILVDRLANPAVRVEPIQLFDQGGPI